MSAAIIVGTSFVTDSLFTEGPASLGGQPLVEQRVATAHGEARVHRLGHASGPVVLFRHGLPHRYLPHQIPYRAQAAALRELGVDRVLVSSSVGLLRPELPLYRPLLLGDLLMPDMRLPDGTACSLFVKPSPDQAHLVVDGGLFDKNLSAQLRRRLGAEAASSGEGLVFAYAMGPRTKTAAENRYWAQAGADVASMSLAPEVVLANELGIACAGLVVGHKHSCAGARAPLDERSLSATLERARLAMQELLLWFARESEPVEFANRFYRF